MDNVTTCKRGHPRIPQNTTTDGRCKVCRKKAVQARLVDHRKQVSTSVNKHRAALRQAAIDAYGRACACCGETVERFLTIDHVNGDGAEHRRQVGPAAQTYRWLRDNEYPDGFQTLCWNCNCGRHINSGLCPHTSTVKEPASASSRSRRKLKVAAVAAYGGKCACCGETELTFLTIDHVDNDGAKQRANVTGNGRGTVMHRWLRQNNWPTGFQVLCFNCNSGKQVNGQQCPHVVQRLRV